jgi:hypothetical protein
VESATGSSQVRPGRDSGQVHGEIHPGAVRQAVATKVAQPPRSSETSAITAGDDAQVFHGRGCHVDRRSQKGRGFL